jgi:uncharacterized protein (UPF0332 family)
MKSKRIIYSNIRQKKKATTKFSIATGELMAAQELITKGLFKESVIHLYFCSFNLAQATLADILKSDKHSTVEREFNRKYGRGRGIVPQKYVRLHNTLHKERELHSYKATYSPKSADVKKWLRLLTSFHLFINRTLDKVTTIDIIKSMYAENPNSVRDFSYDIYCPKTYSHHNRITYWQPPFYIDIFNHIKIVSVLREALRKLKVRKNENYVLGLNSKVSQYSNDHYLMLDFDSLDTDVESVLKDVGGVILRSGRGYHFIGNKIIKGYKNWIKQLNSLNRKKDLKGKIDKDHIKISVLRGYSTLRITDSPIKPNVPLFYKEV